MASIRQESFAGGEIAPQLLGRGDVARYQAALATCRNFLPSPHGPVYNRPGTVAIAETKFYDKKVRLIPFLFGSNQNYVMEFGEKYIRWFVNGVPLAYVGTPVVWSGATTYAAEDYVSHDGRAWRSLVGTNLNHEPEEGAYWTDVGAAAAPVYEITTPYFAAHLPQMKFAQSGDVIVLCHPAYAPRELQRLGSTQWALSTITFDAPAFFCHDLTTDGVPKLELPTGLVTEWASTESYITGYWVSYQGRLYRAHFDFLMGATNAPGTIDSGSGLQNWDEFDIVSAQPWQFKVTCVCEDQHGKRWETQAYSVTKVRAWGRGLYRKWHSYSINDLASKDELPTGTSQRSKQNANYNHALSDTAWWDTEGADAVQTERDVSTLLVLNAATPATLSWPWLIPQDVDFHVVCWRVYRGLGGYFGWVGDTVDGAQASFVDHGQAPDFSVQPPQGRNPFDVNPTDGSTDYEEIPAVVAHYDQRRIFANTYDPYNVWGRPNLICASELGDFDHFDKHDLVTLPDDQVDFRLSSLTYEEIRALVPLKRLLVLTSEAEWVVGGAGGAPLSPLSVEAKCQSYHGSSWLDPLRVASGLVLFVQEAGQHVISLAFSQEAESYQATDLSLWVEHLHEGRQIVDWAWARRPYGLIWAVRDDGVLLSCTYEPGQEVTGWAWHDGPLAYFENVCAVPESVTIAAASIPPGGTDHNPSHGGGSTGATPAVTIIETGVYMVARRLLDGVYRRFVERLSSRRFTDVRTGIFMDGAVGYDGRNPGATTVKVSGGTTYVVGQAVVIDSNADLFSASWVDKHLVLGPDTATPYRVLITTYVGVRQVTGTLVTALPTAWRNVWTPLWALAVNSLQSDFLKGTSCSVLLDGVASTVVANSGGTLSFGTTFASIIRAGRGYYSDLELADLVVQSAQGAQRNATKTVHRVDFEVLASAGLQAGETFSALSTWTPPAPSAYGYQGTTGLVQQRIKNSWNKGGRAVVRQTAPLPLTILSATREVRFGGT